MLLKHRIRVTTNYVVQVIMPHNVQALHRVSERYQSRGHSGLKPLNFTRAMVFDSDDPNTITRNKRSTDRIMSFDSCLSCCSKQTPVPMGDASYSRISEFVG